METPSHYGVNSPIMGLRWQVVDMDGCVGAINTFVVEPFVPHKQEYYMCIQVGPSTPREAAPGTSSGRAEQ